MLFGIYNDLHIFGTLNGGGEYWGDGITSMNNFILVG